MSDKILELFGWPTSSPEAPWTDVVAAQHCPFLNRKCIKTRKSQPEIAIGTCSVRHGRRQQCILICPHRLLERRQIFTDCLHLLTLHEPGNEYHIVPEITVPGGSVDYFLVSARNGRVKDFAGIELQTLDTTGTIWPARQRLLEAKGLRVDPVTERAFGMNWKMTAKTILVQLHHKIATFEGLNKHLVLVTQDHLLDYMSRQFAFDHLSGPSLGNPMHFHAYNFRDQEGWHRIDLASRLSTNTAGIAACLGLQTDPNIELEKVSQTLESKISEATLFTF